jgi:GT2 family glycosyltransferase
MVGQKKSLILPFFCVKIPYAVYSRVGPMDENFGRGSAEDSDYCLRAWLAGFEVRHALQSYVLHFGGKSSWAGETKRESEERMKKFRELFEKKWGAALADLVLNENTKGINASAAG